MDDGWERITTRIDGGNLVYWLHRLGKGRWLSVASVGDGRWLWAAYDRPNHRVGWGTRSSSALARVAADRFAESTEGRSALWPS